MTCVRLDSTFVIVLRDLNSLQNYPIQTLGLTAVCASRQYGGILKAVSPTAFLSIAKINTHLYLSKAMAAFVIAPPMPDKLPNTAYMSHPSWYPNILWQNEFMISRGISIIIIRSNTARFMTNMLLALRSDLDLEDRKDSTS